LSRPTGVGEQSFAGDDAEKFSATARYSSLRTPARRSRNRPGCV